MNQPRLAELIIIDSSDNEFKVKEEGYLDDDEEDGYADEDT